MGCTRREDSEHRLKELQRQLRATTISADTRDGHEMLRLLLQPPRSLCASTGHYPHLLSWEPVPGSRDPGTTSQGEHTVCLRLLQCHASLCRHRLTLHTIPLLPPALSEPEPLNQALLQPHPETPSGDQHAEAGPNPKLKARSCVNKEKKGKFLPAASGAVD